MIAIWVTLIQQTGNNLASLSLPKSAAWQKE